ncbi:MAG: hypothetical protein CMJ72_06665 [Planctomycetaceae bacterium]|nr:hypothetical protein [Planctomycetaceae bacterium]HCK41209.1 hypothetical protein [Planctomycetaceae bacterium]
MTLQQILLTNAQVLACAVCLLWGISLYRRDASIVDPFWGLGFVLVSWISAAVSGGGSPRTLLVVALVSVWGIRLSAYLTWRNWGKPEDYRYAAMREHHGWRFPLVSLLTVFLLQGTIMWAVSLPIQVGVAENTSSHLPAWIGSCVYGIGFLFESLGDYQLARFKAQPANRGQVMNRGLWRYTRHPNYFGDFLVWWGIYLLVAAPSTWWWTLVGPLLMSILLIRVSGVRLLENSLSKRLVSYDEYVRSTSAFFPWPPKSG